MASLLFSSEFFHTAVCLQRLLRAPQSKEQSQETVWPPTVNYVFTAGPGSLWARSVHLPAMIKGLMSVQTGNLNMKEQRSEIHAAFYEKSTLYSAKNINPATNL